MTGIASFFQAASPILIQGGGRMIGIPPGYVLLAVGFWHFGKICLEDLTPGKQRRAAIVINGRLFTLILYTVIGVAGSLFLPRLFEGQAQIMPPGLGLDSGITERLEPSGTNFNQAFYLVCNFFLSFFIYAFLQWRLIDLATILKGVTIGVTLSLCFGFYQILSFHVGVPWPSDFINSNEGIGQQYEQTFAGLNRMSATFQEPSIMSMHFLSAFGVAALGLQNWRLALPILVALIVSTSSLAYFGLVVLLTLWILLEFPSHGIRILWPVALLSLIILLSWAVDNFFLDGQIIEFMVVKKFEGESGMSRLNADMSALDAFLDTYGFGVGIGSTRASSFAFTLLATMGVFGAISFLVLMMSCIVYVWREPTKNARGLLFGLLGLLISWFMAIPDIFLPLVWLLVGAAMSNDLIIRNRPSRADGTCSSINQNVKETNEMY
ncbi:MAG: O-antigen ligase family protein [Methylococcales bacterium]|nr:O-antigen ligase family protein [Methylococcales bacterium]